MTTFNVSPTQVISYRMPFRPRGHDLVHRITGVERLHGSPSMSDDSTRRLNPRAALIATTRYALLGIPVLLSNVGHDRT